LRQVIDEDDAVQVVDLVLNAHRQQAIGFHRPLLAVEVEVFDGDPLGTLDLVVDAGHRQAAFFADLLTAAFLQGRIDEGEKIVLLFRHVDDHDALASTWSPPADARRFVHGFGHVGDQFSNAGIDLGDGLRDLFQARIGKTQNG
jgi:hypothetical protein